MPFQFTCEWCGASFVRDQRQTAANPNRFCCRTCQNKGRARTKAARLWHKTDKNGPIPEYRPEIGRCWLYLGNRNRGGYGRIGGRVGDAIELAHRVAFADTYGPIPDDMDVLHICDNPSCVRPDHLFLGTHADNMRDAAEKGRTRGPFLKGERHPMSRMTDSDVREIRRLLSEGVLPSAIAKQFGVSQTHVGRIRDGKSWRHVE